MTFVPVQQSSSLESVSVATTAANPGVVIKGKEIVRGKVTHRETMSQQHLMQPSFVGSFYRHDVLRTDLGIE